MMGHPPQDKISRLVSNKSSIIQNMPFTAKDLSNSTALFGPDRGTIRGKTTRRKPSTVRPELIQILRDLFDRLQHVVIAADVMFLNGLSFFVMKSRGIKLLTVEYLPSRTAAQLCSSLKTVKRIYHRGGFQVHTCLMDMEFEKLTDLMDDVVVNTTAAREGVLGDIELEIQPTRDRLRSTTFELPCGHCMPDLFIACLIKFV
jgi:hypothetical protein